MLRHSDTNRTEGGYIVVTGGARSGKSAFAEQLAGRIGARSGRPVVYVATAQPFDDEMTRRIEHHRSGRPADWQTVEAPQQLEDALERLSMLPADRQPGAVLVDCVTVWLSNVLLSPGPAGEEQWMRPDFAEQLERRVERLSLLLGRLPFPAVLVTNEVGHALVPEYKLGRVFRDLAGRANQSLANQAGDVFYVVCGVSLNLRRLAWKPDEEEETDRW
jgi:adenosylcobinamide kinase / adenosylcobinamide-phosphate guanylyltransferase